MKNERRNHPALILKYMYISIKQLIFPLLIVVLTNLKSWELPLVILGGGLLVIGVFLISYLGWKNYIFYLEENMLWVEKGIFTKNKKGIALDKITTVNDNQGIVESFFKLVTLKIDTGSMSGGKRDNEVSLLLPKEEVEALKLLLTSSIKKQQPEKQLGLAYTTSHKELFIYALTSNSVFAGLIFLSTVYQMIKDLPVIDHFVEGTFKTLFNNTFDTPISEMAIGKAVLVVTFLFTVYLLFSFAISILRAMVKYYDFTVARDQNKIIISYGLLEKKKFSMPVGKIKAVYCKYGLIGQIFSLSSIYLESIGYGDERGEIAILYPLLTESKKEAIIRKLIPEFEFSGTFSKPPKRALKSYLMRSLLVPIVLCTIATIAFSYGYWLYLLLPLLALGGYRAYKNSGILEEEKNIILCKGALTRQVIILPREAIQSTTYSQNFLQKRKDLFNISFSYQSNTFGKNVGVRYMEKNGKF